jgi:hypothetical protein
MYCMYVHSCRTHNCTVCTVGYSTLVVIEYSYTKMYTLYMSAENFHKHKKSLCVCTGIPLCGMIQVRTVLGHSAKSRVWPFYSTIKRAKFLIPDFLRTVPALRRPHIFLGRANFVPMQQAATTRTTYKG